VPQPRQKFHLRSAPRGNVARQERNAAQQQRKPAIRDGVNRLDVKQLRSQKSRKRRGRAETMPSLVPFSREVAYTKRRTDATACVSRAQLFSSLAS